PDLLAELTNHTAASAFGMGIGTSDGAELSLRWLLENAPGRLVIDADGLTLLSRMENHRQLLRKAASRPDAKGPRVILTPHLKEFSRLTGVSVREIEADPIPLARAYAADTASVLLLKGPATIITDGSHVWLTDTGCPGMATAGSGDVLSGILTALAGWMEDVRFAAVAAAWINGRAGELAEAETNSVSMVAGDTVRCIPRVISGLLP
ncbi:MAG: NAD(P)H-hydrate dehydratase, partial [Clostridia bacterium]|nr:NAD(P)H-hydrate dehydratase [Clostridia bacterium]